MPELPDIVVYVESLERRIVGSTLTKLRLNNPFLLRTATPPIPRADGKRVVGARRMGKRIVLELEGKLFLAIHLMVAGRLKWLPATAKPPGKSALAVFEFDSGFLVFTEAGTKRRASLHFVAGEGAVQALHAGGIEVLDLDLATFSRRLKSDNHTLKRALTDPHIFSGIGNAYSDEILHRARLSPIVMTGKLLGEEVTKLFDAVRGTLSEWIDRLRKQAGTGFPEKVTAFRRHGGTWAIRQALPGVWLTGPTHCLCRKRNQLLRPLPDRRENPCRSGIVATAQEKLAEIPG